uniref:Single cache domain-containing protein n=1 Tax=candidate division WOR-3 bacterium TaxID=2052148 RepID=A0A7C4Y4R1_UNCW3
MIKNGIIFGLLGFIVVFGILFLKELTKEGGNDIAEMVTNDYITRGKFFSFIVREYVEMEDEIGSSAVLNMLKENFKGAKNITVITNDGTILADFDSTKVLEKFKGTMVGNKEIQKVQEGKNMYIGIPVKSGDKKIGEIHIALDMEKFEKKKGFDTKKIIYAVASFLIFFIAGLFIKGGKKEVAQVIDTSSLTAEVENLKQVISNLKKEEEGTIKIIEDKKKEIETIEKEIITKKKELENINAEFSNISEKRKEIENLKSELASLEVKLEDKRSELENLEKNIKEMKEKVPVENEEEALLGNLIGNNIDARLEEKKKQEVELTQRIVAKRREEITISARIEAKKKELMELEKKIESLKKQA